LLAELAFPGPVVHAAIAVCGSLLLLADGALPRAVGSCFAISLLPTLGWTGAALSRREDRGQLLLDLLRLPGYAIWRLYTAAGALVGVRSSQWERSPREPSG
jgi:hypothetical protein